MKSNAAFKLSEPSDVRGEVHDTLTTALFGTDAGKDAMVVIASPDRPMPEAILEPGSENPIADIIDISERGGVTAISPSPDQPMSEPTGEKSTVERPEIGQPESATVDIAAAESAVPETVIDPEIDPESDIVGACDEVVTKVYGGNLEQINGVFYSYRNGYWSALHPDVGLLKRIFDFYGWKVPMDTIHTLIKYLRIRQSETSFVPPPDDHLICLPNGTLDPRAGRLMGHDPKYRLRNLLNIPWDPEATCPEFMNFLDSIFRDDADKLEKIRFLQQWAGYLLIPTTHQQKFLWLIGAGANGKSVLLKVLEALVGKENASHVNLDRLGDRFSSAHLEGKLLNISSELSPEATLSENNLKAITASDTIHAERKGKDGYSFTPYARLIASANELPRLRDLTPGFHRRAIILTFNRSFEEHEQDRGLEAKLLAELAGILVWAVEGLKDLLAAQHLSIPPSSQQAVSQYFKEADSVALFAEELLVKLAPDSSPSAGLIPLTLYGMYKEYCQDNGLMCPSNVTFGKRLARLGYEKRRSNGSDYWQVQRKPRAMADADRSPVDDEICKISTKTLEEAFADN
jgi:P4 family phage/plasmid primase-like protien